MQKDLSPYAVRWDNKDNGNSYVSLIVARNMKTAVKRAKREFGEKSKIVTATKVSKSHFPNFHQMDAGVKHTEQVG